MRGSATSPFSRALTPSWRTHHEESKLRALGRACHIGFKTRGKQCRTFGALGPQAGLGLAGKSLLREIVS
eukprot:15446919-Alexandrium_andersonii.AAC.1